MALCSPPVPLVQEMLLLRSQMSGQINVAVDAAPSSDLNQVMSDIRDHYEGVIGKNRKDLESWYQTKVRRPPRSSQDPDSFRSLHRPEWLTAASPSPQMAAVEQDVKLQTETLVTTRTEIKELKSTLQRLQIELQSHLSMVPKRFSWTTMSHTAWR